MIKPNTPPPDEVEQGITFETDPNEPELKPYTDLTTHKPGKKWKYTCNK